MLLVGVTLGLGVSAYRTHGRPRDEVLIRVARLRTQMRGDPQLAASFQSRIEARLVEAERALQNEEWENARKTTGEAESTLDRWRRGRGDWLGQMAYQESLVKRLDDFDPNAVYIQTVRSEFGIVDRNAPDMEGPDKLREKLEDIASQVNQYVRMRAKLDELSKLRTQLTAAQTEERETWRRKALRWEQRLDELSPIDTTAYQALNGEIDTARDSLAQLLASQKESEASSEGIRDTGGVVVALLEPAPSASPLTSDKQATRAGMRLRFFTSATYVIAVVLLAGAGFAELYVNRPSFGATPWADYFALLAWGFGAEASRAAVADLMRSWGVTRSA